MFSAELLVPVSRCNGDLLPSEAGRIAAPNCTFVIGLLRNTARVGGEMGGEPDCPNMAKGREIGEKPG